MTEAGMKHYLSASDLYQIGKVVSAHGIKGKLEVALNDDLLERIDPEYVFVAIDGLPVPYFVTSCSLRSRQYALLQLEGISSASDAQLLVGSCVMYPKADVPPREADTDDWRFLLGYTVSDVNHGLIGEIVDIDDQSANVLLYVHDSQEREFILPLHPQLVKSVDEPRRSILMDLPDGLLTLNN